MANPKRRDFRRKIKTLDELRTLIGTRPRRKTVIMCHGTFDVVHPGHIRHLLFAKSKADLLIASLTGDAHVAKGEFRPFVPEALRAMNLAALEAVDYVLIDQNPTPLGNLRTLQPDYFAKGFDYIKGGTGPRTREEIEVVETYGGEVIFTPGDIVYSSSALLKMAPPDIGADKLAILMETEKLSFADLRAALVKLAGIKVHVVGDTIVDTISRGTVIGGSTKTPTISLRLESRVDYAGGAAVVAKHLAAAGAAVTFSTVLGDDPFKDFVVADMKAAGVDCLPQIDPTRPTTHKNAFVADGYRLLKVDSLDNRPIAERHLRQFEGAIYGVAADAVVFADYRHGIFGAATVPRLAGAIRKDTFRVADSQVASRWGNILEFRDFDLITPTEREARFALGDQDAGVRPLGEALFRQARCKTLLLKLGERGLIAFRTRPADDYRSFFVVDSFVDRIIDAVGAGDALLAYATLAQIATGNEAVAAILGSLAAAIECEHEGNIPVTPDAVLAKIAASEKRANFD